MESLLNTIIITIAHRKTGDKRLLFLIYRHNIGNIGELHIGNRIPPVPASLPLRSHRLKLTQSRLQLVRSRVKPARKKIWVPP